MGWTFGPAHRVSEVPFKAQTVLPSDGRFKLAPVDTLCLYIANHREL